MDDTCTYIICMHMVVSNRGALYADKLYDGELAKSLLNHLQLPRIESPMVLEGGSIHTDGEG